MEQTVLDLLRERLPAIQTAVLSRIFEVMPAAMVRDSDYEQGLRTTAVALIEYSLQYLAGSSGDSIPVEAFTQLRRAVQHGVSIEVVMMRYIAAHGQLGEFVMDAASEADIPPLRELRRRQDELLQWLTSTVAREYRLEQERQGQSEYQHRVNAVRSLLAGKQLDVDLRYKFDAWHVGVIAAGASSVIARTLASVALDRNCQLLSVPIGAETVWAWLGKDDQSNLEIDKRRVRDGSISLAVGESAYGVDGWRLTHHEAQAARQVALHGRRGVVRCVDVLLDAAILRDETISRALMTTYLLPLDSLRIGGDVARDTLTTYLKCQRCVSKTAAVLGVTRKTVESRLRDIESALGRRLAACCAELEVALRLEQR